MEAWESRIISGRVNGRSGWSRQRAGVSEGQLLSICKKTLGLGLEKAPKNTEGGKVASNKSQRTEGIVGKCRRTGRTNCRANSGKRARGKWMKATQTRRKSWLAYPPLKAGSPIDCQRRLEDCQGSSRAKEHAPELPESSKSRIQPMNDTGKCAEEADGRAGPEGRASRVNLGGGDKEPGEHTRELGTWCAATHNRVKATGKKSDGGREVCRRNTPNRRERPEMHEFPEEQRKSVQSCYSRIQAAGGTDRGKLAQRKWGWKFHGRINEAKSKAKTEFQRHKEGEDGWGVGGHVIEPGDRAGGAGEPDIRGKVYQREREEEYSRSSAEPHARRRRAKPGILDERFRATAKPEQLNLEDEMSSSFRKGSLDPQSYQGIGKTEVPEGTRDRKRPLDGGVSIAG
ncbi:hypothetical protein R3P38DRAFT_2815385 [Favolaschia claudopus]|uniref:Uncharacterized protein n=1 Tax=Favolaschia claudopus TaxID=2862362 RepID=A0AAV9Z1T0_9AGAR